MPSAIGWWREPFVTFVFFLFLVLFVWVKTYLWTESKRDTQHKNDERTREKGESAKKSDHSVYCVLTLDVLMFLGTLERTHVHAYISCLFFALLHSFSFSNRSGWIVKKKICTGLHPCHVLTLTVFFGNWCTHMFYIDWNIRKFPSLRFIVVHLVSTFLFFYCTLDLTFDFVVIV